MIYSLVHAQVVDDLCFDFEYTKRISVKSDFDPDSLSIFDKLKFETKSFSEKQHEYINSNGNSTRDKHLVSHENMYPKWYTPPTHYRIDESGVKSFFTEVSDYLPGGWTGAEISQTEHGDYIENIGSGERLLSQNYSVDAAQAYQSWNQFSIVNGFLPKYSFSYPVGSELQDLQTSGFQVTISYNIIHASNALQNLVWDTAEKVFLRQKLESGTVVRTEKSYYSYNQDFQKDLIHLSVTTIPSNFTTGECFDEIVYKRYTNYSDTCSQMDVSYNRQGDTSEKRIINDELKVYPIKKFKSNNGQYSN